MGTTDRFDFSTFDNGVGNSGFGQAHGPGIDLRPELPQSTPDLIAVDLTHRIDTSEIGAASSASASASAQGGGGGKPGGGGGLSFANYTAGASGAYNITIEFKGSNWTQALHDQFTQAADRLVTLITGDIPDVTVIMKGAKLVDDIYITAELKAIDGAGGILGQAGPTSIRTGSYFPATASMQFDSADAQVYQDQGLFGVIVTHEMLHSVGFGSIWSYKGLVDGASNFTGAQATAEYQALTHNPGASGPPVETDGGSGTAGSHWDEQTFHDELMTGYINVGLYGSDTVQDPLSRLTVASLGDLGYQVNLNSTHIDGYALTV